MMMATPYEGYQIEGLGTEWRVHYYGQPITTLWSWVDAVKWVAANRGVSHVRYPTPYHGITIERVHSSWCVALPDGEHVYTAKSFTDACEALANRQGKS